MDALDNMEDNSNIVAFNNDVTPFELVFYVLHTVVPMSQDQAFSKTREIHEQGKSLVYTGSRSHCEKIGQALKTIKVEYEIYSTND